jgi:hypothetical protein
VLKTARLESHIILFRAEKTGDPNGWEAYTLDVVSGQQSADAVEGRANIWQMAAEAGLICGQVALSGGCTT